MSLASNIARRKCVRAYLDKPVSDEDVKTIVEAGRWAPNHGEFHLTVVRKPELRKRLNDAAKQAMINSGMEFLQERAALPGYEPLYGAPVVVLVSGPADNPSTPINCSLSADNMLLEATELGLASCFIVTPGLAFRSDQALAKDAGVPEGYTFVCGVLFGYGTGSDPFSDPNRQPKGEVSYID